MVYLALDGELDTDQMKGFLYELDRCSCCFDSFEVEKAFRQFLTSKIERRCMPPGAHDALKAKLGFTHSPDDANA